MIYGGASLGSTEYAGVNNGTLTIISTLKGLFFMRSRAQHLPLGLDGSPKNMMYSRQQKHPLALDNASKNKLHSSQQDYPLPLDHTEII